MIKITKEKVLKASIAGIFSTITIGFLALLTYKTPFGLFLAASFGASMVLLYGFPESPFSQPKNIFFGHFLTTLIGIIFVNYIYLPIFINIALSVGLGIFFMIIFDVVHPPAGGNPIMVIIGGVSYEYLINPIIFSCLIILLFGIILNKFILKKNYPLVSNFMNSKYKILNYKPTTNKELK
jgi:CBS-domain-containing membrane protein